MINFSFGRIFFRKISYVNLTPPIPLKRINFYERAHRHTHSHTHTVRERHTHKHTHTHWKRERDTQAQRDEYIFRGNRKWWIDFFPSPDTKTAINRPEDIEQYTLKLHCRLGYDKHGRIRFDITLEKKLCNFVGLQYRYHTTKFMKNCIHTIVHNEVFLNTHLQSFLSNTNFLCNAKLYYEV